MGSMKIFPDRGARRVTSAGDCSSHSNLRCANAGTRTVSVANERWSHDLHGQDAGLRRDHTPPWSARQSRVRRAEPRRAEPRRRQSETRRPLFALRTMHHAPQAWLARTNPKHARGGDVPRVDENALSLQRVVQPRRHVVLAEEPKLADLHRIVGTPSGAWARGVAPIDMRAKHAHTHTRTRSATRSLGRARACVVGRIRAQSLPQAAGFAVRWRPGGVASEH